MALIGSYIWFVLDAVRGVRLLRWLRNGVQADIALGPGLWSEVYDRTRKMARAYQRSAVEGESRLQD